ncbi:hypothetical protein LUZ60_012460 [Juncus effusus]|nr:hypothetical protein LUZ60_012460 [Juncus effusus]
MASSSTSIEEFISIREITLGSYKLKINYAQTKDSSKEGFIYSPKFNFCVHEWQIGYWTTRSEEEKPLLMFILRSKPSNVKTSLDLSLLNKDGNPSLTFSTRDSYASPILIVRRNRFRKECLVDGFFSVLCTLFNVAGSINEVSMTSGLNENLGSNLLKSSEEMADLIFEVDGEIFRVHKAVLVAKSHGFRAELGSVDEVRTEHIKIEDMKAAVFKCLIHYMYTNSFEAKEYVLIQDLLVAAHRYALDHLRMMCEERLCNNVSLDMVTSFLVFAEQHNCNRLKDVCLDFATELENHVLLSLRDDYLELMQKYPCVFSELGERVSRSVAFKELIGKKQRTDGDCEL